MEPGSRKERERAERRRAIITAARDIAESEGWPAVTTRRLAQSIEYSQPVIYGHFANMQAIVAAVAIEGIVELTVHLRRARLAAAPENIPDAVAWAYLDFARAHPALFDAMFTLPNGLDFGGPDAPVELVDAFGELIEAFAPLAKGEDQETYVEMAWSAIHGQTVLGMSGRLRPQVAAERMAMLVRVLKRE
ncbi:TetR family transcriptional regulator [Actinorhabdospora filicis]|uniref:TetR family transcriptional regulator n=1 Tax=Actinorhabdospora filicis TaxID=1785913 RepID=A0A9W6WAF5_9ACTN|nr:TetR/AcrR family transcriptional regulator [Actinorhabdospora filicis]GLZ78546.1 TetR family transcriptional regulator [Actinorhabdospora filicis]